MRLKVSARNQRRRVSVEQAEADYFAESAERYANDEEPETDEERVITLQKPFGYANEQWEALKRQIRRGDELWEYCSSRSSWDCLMGRAGYELVRDGKVVAEVVCRMN